MAGVRQSVVLPSASGLRIGCGGGGGGGGSLGLGGALKRRAVTEAVTESRVRELLLRVAATRTLPSCQYIGPTSHIKRILPHTLSVTLY
jgi:hypothetical protein